jgi:hypothetical protein
MSEDAIEIKEGRTYSFQGITFRLKRDAYGAAILYSDNPRVQFGSTDVRARYQSEGARSVVIIRLDKPGAEQQRRDDADPLGPTWKTG